MYLTLLANRSNTFKTARSPHGILAVLQRIGTHAPESMHRPQDRPINAFAEESHRGELEDEVDSL
jgi:hypothetical protein